MHPVWDCDPDLRRERARSKEQEQEQGDMMESNWVEVGQTDMPSALGWTEEQEEMEFAREQSKVKLMGLVRPPCLGSTGTSMQCTCTSCSSLPSVDRVACGQVMAGI